MRLPATRREFRRNRSRALIALVTTATIVMATVLAAPASVGASQAGTHRLNLSHTLGQGQRVDARAAAAAAAGQHRERKVLALLRPELGAKPSEQRQPDTKSLASGGARTPTASVGPKIVTPPAPVVTTQFAGIAMSEVCSCEPPDPWIAVSPSYVVQTTNGMVRVSNRSGVTLLAEPTWALFAVPADRSDSDPRILWDPIHARWVGIILTFNGDFTENSLNLAISEGADPTGAWSVYSIEYGAIVPDYPGISTSANRIVMTSNDFSSTLNYLGPTWLNIDWSDIINGTTVYLVYDDSEPNTAAHFRPAVMLSTSANTPVIYEKGASPAYFEISGPIHGATRINNRDIKTDLTLADFTLPPPPVQPGSVAISDAADDRPTDAVYRNGSLWFAATADYFDGVNHWAQARYTVVNTAANGTAPTTGADFFGVLSGTHFFMPGVGIDADGLVIVSATKTDATSTYPTTVIGGIIPGIVLYPYVDVATSSTAYSGTRWGDFVGIAADPSGAGSVWIEHELVAADGSWQTKVARVVSDATPPGSPGLVTQAQVTPTSLFANTTVKTSWGAAADAGSGIRGYLIQRSDNGGPYAGLETPATSISQPLVIGPNTYRYRVSAIDGAGNQGTPTYGPLYHASLIQSTTSNTTYTGTWHTVSGSYFSGGGARYSTAAGATATFTSTLARSIAIVVTRATSRGSFKVYVDGVYKATVSSYGSPTVYRRIVWQYAWTTAGTHKVKIVISGTSGHPRVDVDAFVVLR